MAAFVPKDELLKKIHEAGCYGVLLDETSIVNLPVVQAMLGLNESSAKKWMAKYDVRRLPGGAWMTTGRQLFIGMERYFQDHQTGDLQ